MPHRSDSRAAAVSRRAALAALGGGLASAAFPRHAAAAKTYPATWRFGDVTVTKVVDLTGPFDAARAFPGAPLGELDANADWLVPHFYDPAAKAILFSYHSYVVRTPKRTIVVDCGQGNDKTRGGPFANMRRGPYLQNFATAGFTPEQVDFVMCTHFHSDHTGWNTRLVDGRWVPTFPKARYLFNRAELAGVEKSLTGAVKQAYDDSLLPVIEAGRVDMIDGGYDFGHGVEIVPSPGHTPGHMSLAIASKGRRAILSGDIIHNPIEVLHPEWEVLFDQDKNAGRAQRQTFVDAHTDVDVTVFAAHFGGPTAGRIVSRKDGKRWFKTLVA
jgi:glyoxylase-like metal-dependent hydrolase (beta-lactamase superfamily II)